MDNLVVCYANFVIYKSFHFTIFIKNILPSDEKKEIQFR